MKKRLSRMALCHAQGSPSVIIPNLIPVINVLKFHVGTFVKRELLFSFQPTKNKLNRAATNYYFVE